MTAPARSLAVEELYLRHDAALRRFLVRMLHCEEAAADAAQEAWMRLIRFAPGRTMDDSRAYVFQVAANVARDRLAEARRRDRVVVADAEAAERVACPEPDAEAAAQAAERQRLLAAAVDELTPRCREVFLMSRLDGLANGEIAARLGISRNMVEKHIIRAMLHCRRRLDAAGK